MSVRNLSHTSALLALRGEIKHTLDQVAAHPLTAAHVPAYEGLRDDWGVVFNEELALRDKQSAVAAGMVWIKVTLHGLAGDVSKRLLRLTEDDRTHPLYVAYFKKKALNEFKRLGFSEQTEAMRGWIPELKASGVPALATLGTEIEAAVDTADKAVKSRDALAAQCTFFRETGNRKKLFDKVNAVRNLTFAALAKMPHDNVGLPRNFADLFFLHESSSDERPAATLDAIDQELADLEKQVAKKQEQRKGLVAELEGLARGEVKDAAKQAAIAALQDEAAAATKKVAEAQAKILELSK
jgi:hypothetical protein